MANGRRKCGRKNGDHADLFSQVKHVTHFLFCQTATQLNLIVLRSFNVANVANVGNGGNL